MAVKITEQMYDTFINNGYTEDDIENTVNHYREQGMPDSAIFTNMNKKHRELAGIKDVVTPQMGDQPNYDAIMNNPALTPQQQAQAIQQQGEAYRAGLDKDLATQKAKMYTGAAIKIASPLVGLGLAPFTGGMSLPASMATLGLAEGATFGVGEALQNQKRGGEFAKDVATQGLLGGALGAGTGALFKYAAPALQTGIKNINPRYRSVMQRRNVPLSERYISPEELQKYINVGEPQPSQFGVNAIDTEANAQIAKQIEQNIQAEKELYNEYRGVHSNAVKKYGSIENLKKQAVADMPQNTQYGLKTDAIRDYQDLIAYERSLADAKYIENKILPSATREGKVRLPKQAPLAEAPTVGEAPIQQLAPNKFAIEADTNVPTSQVEQPTLKQEPVKEGFVRLYRGLTNEFDPKYNKSKLDNINGYESWTDNYDLAKAYGDKVYHIDVPKSKIASDVIDENPKSMTYGDRNLLYKHDKPVGIKGESGNEYMLYTAHDDYGTLKYNKVNQPQVNVPEMVQPQVPVPQGQVKTRGGIKTVGTGLGEDVAKAVSDTDYTTRGLAVNKAEFTNLAPEQQADLVNTDEISDLSIYAKIDNLKNKLNAGELPQRDLNKFVKQGTEQGQAMQARTAANMNTPVGALVGTQSVIRKATPKRINDIIDNADNIVDAVTTARTSVAKVTNLENALKGTVKGERKYLVDRILKLEADGQLNADNVIKLVNKKYNIPEITQPDIEKIKELTTRIAEATTERESEVAKGLLRKFMVDKVPKTGRNKVNTYRYINMLLSPKSRSKDFIFTAAFQGEQMIDEVFAQLPALASKHFKGINTRSGLQPKAWVGGLKKGLREGAEDVKLGIETGRAGEGTRYDLPRGQQFAYSSLKDIGVEPNVIKKIAMAGESTLSQLEKALNYTIRVPDRMFYEAKYASSIADQLKAAGVKKPTSEMIEQAVKEAKDAVYQGDTWASRISLGSRDLLNKIPTGPVKVGDLTMPFVQTVANISEEGLKNVGGLPVGMAKWGMAKTPTELRDAELLIGKGLKSLGYLGVGGGIAGGAIKSNIGDLSLTGRDRDAVTGMQPQSIAIGNKSFSLANAPNVTIPIGIYRSLLEQGTPQERAARAAMTAMSAIGDMPAFKTLGDLSKGVGQIAGNFAQEDLQGAQESAVQMGSQQIANITGQFVPLTGAMGNIRNIVDPSSREQYSQDLGQYIGNKTINRIPFASQSLPQRYGLTGEPVMMTNIQNPIARAVGELFDPFSIRNYTPNSTIDTMSSLTKQSEDIKGNKAFNIKKAKRSIDINGVRTKLSPKEYSKYQKDYGKINYYLRQKALNSDTFKMMDSEEKVKYMQDLNSSVDQAVKSVLFNHSPKKQARFTQEIIDNYDTFTK